MDKRFDFANRSQACIANTPLPSRLVRDGMRWERLTKHGAAMEIAIAQDSREFGKAWHHIKSWTDDTDT